MLPFITLQNLVTSGLERIRIQPVTSLKQIYSLRIASALFPRSTRFSKLTSVCGMLSSPPGRRKLKQTTGDSVQSLTHAYLETGGATGLVLDPFHQSKHILRETTKR